MKKEIMSPIWGVLERDEIEDTYGFTQVIKNDQIKDSKTSKKNKKKSKAQGLEELLLED